MRKLHHYGIRGSMVMHHWISSFLSGRTQKVIVEWCSSDSVPVVSGVPPNQFWDHCCSRVSLSNDLPSKTRLFVDDCIVYRQINMPERCVVLQEDLNTLTEWESKWDMPFRPQKCSALSISRPRPPSKSPII